MAKKALTARSVDAMKAPASGRTQVYDATLPGLMLRVTARGHKSFAVVYRIDRRQRKLTIGSYPTWSLAEARDAAREALQRVERGEDPAEDKQEAKATRAPDRDTVAKVAREYIERHVSQTKKATQTQRLIEAYVTPVIGDLDMAQLGRKHVRDVVDRVVDAGRPVQANRVLTAVHGLCAWAVERDVIETNPAAGVRKPTKEKPRERVLTDGELRAVWDAAGELGYPAGPLFKLLILTGARRDEAREMRWSEVDLTRGVWTLPAGRSKGGAGRDIPLSTAAQAVLVDLPRFQGGDHVFTANDGSKPYANLIKPKRRIDRDSDVTGWTLHDLRRTAASGMGALGIAGETIARVLGHSEGAIAGVTARYNRADQLEAKRRALEAWGQHVTGLHAGNVVELHAG